MMKPWNWGWPTEIRWGDGASIFVMIVIGLWVLWMFLLPFILFLVHYNLVKLRRELNRAIIRADARLATMEQAAQAQVEASNAAYNARYQKV